MMDAKYLQEIKEREQAATPGTWEYADVAGEIWSADGNTVIGGTEGEGISVSKPDAAFITAARTDIPALIAEVERLQAERDAAVALHKDCAKELNAAHKNHADDFMRLNVEISTLKSASEIQLQTMNALTVKMVTLEKALEMMYAENKSYNPDGMGNPAWYIRQAQEQEEKE